MPLAFPSPSRTYPARAPRLGIPSSSATGRSLSRSSEWKVSGWWPGSATGECSSAHAGLFLPRAKLRTEILGEKDLADLRLALEEGVDYVAISFVRAGEDLTVARKAVDRIPTRGRGGADRQDRAGRGAP